MNPVTVAGAAAYLLDGKLPEVQPTDLAAAVRQIADSIETGSEPPAALQVRAALKALNGARHFDHTKTIGSVWHGRRGIDPTIQKQYAQAQIELGAFGDAQTLLLQALEAAKTSTDPQAAIETPEYRGLLGRIRKQMYVQSGDANELVGATDEYLKQYDFKKLFYHGINIVALRMEEERLQLRDRPGASTTQMAEQVLQLATNSYWRDSSDHWSLATASEACLALTAGDPNGEWCDRAELWLYRFLNHANTNAFAVESYARQLREIWRGNPLGGPSCADRLAAIIERHVRRTERRWSIEPAKVREVLADPTVLEKNFSNERTFNVATLKKMLELCPNIGCVIDSTGARLGTGFLMEGAAFRLNEPLVFVTNAHVISDEWETSIPSSDAQVTFEIETVAARRPVPHAVKKVLFTSDPGELSELSKTLEKLDVTIVSLDTVPANVPGLKPAANVPLPSPTTKAFVVGHPAAGALQFSLHDSMLLDVCDDERLMHYRTPTDPGSSGSPVFNSNWQVVALHHGGAPNVRRLHGEGEYEANEGITLRSIRRKLGAV
jgi:V8-like Glu-specific endopeptidase